MLKLYSLFHLNLMYSSITEAQRQQVIEKCYWPLLHLAEKGIPIALEATAITLEIIAKEDNGWLKKLYALQAEDKVTFVGSGYAQIIGPLVPWKVNQWNQTIGMEVYEDLLYCRPQLALVNEMAYSAGVLEHYQNEGYQGLILDWNNPYKFHSEWSKELQYHHQVALAGEVRMPILWSNAILFQKFQRYAHGELSEDDYVAYLKSHDSDDVRYLSLYSGDAEVFNYRPGRYSTESELSPTNEWESILRVYERLANDTWVELVSPQTLLSDDSPHGGQILRLEAAEQPISVKKQEKYNIIRWALTGRDDRKINTLCYRIFEGIQHTDDSALKKQLCYLWSSDFRTHIVPERWFDFYQQLCKMNDEHGLAIDQSDKLRTTTTMPFENSRVQVRRTEETVVVESSQIKLALNLSRGMSIRELIFKDVSPEPLVSMLPHGYYDDIAFAADFYSGHAVIEEPGRHKITDLQACEPHLFVGENSIVFNVRLTVSDVVFEKELSYFIDDGAVELCTRIHLSERKVRVIRPMHITFNPKAFERETLFFATHNGGQLLERYDLSTKDVDYFEQLSPLISSKHGLGATEGTVVVGDKEKQFICRHQNSFGYVVPALKISSLDDQNYFLRLQYSAQEIDETFKSIPQQCTIQTKHRLIATRF